MTPARPRRATAGVGLLFAANGATFAALLPWYPLLSRQLDLSSIEFGFIVAAFAVGALLSSALPAPLIRRFGPLRVVIGGTIVLGVAVAGAGWSTAGWMLAVCIFGAGFSDAVADVAQNVAGIRVQDRAGRSILSSMHALWSLGGVAGGAAATLAAAAGADIRGYLVGAAIVGVLLTLVGSAMIGPVAEASDHPEVARHVSAGAAWRVTLIAVLPLAALTVCGSMVEDFANNWAAMSAAELGGLAPQIAGIGFTVVIASQCIGRFSGDVLIERFGRVAVARAGGVLITVGALGIVIAQPVTFFVGLAAVGYGSATLVPSAFTAAAKLPGLRDGTGVMLVSWLLRVGFLITSPLIGTLADTIGLRLALFVIAVAGVSAVMLAGRLGEAVRNTR